jgi:NADH-quinone oxidoreductase subunit G
VLPDAGPGLTGVESGRDAEGIRAALEADELKSLLLFGSDPVRDHPDSAAWDRALKSADFVVAFAMFEDASAAQADVILPLQSHAEKEGTVTHPDGRLQRVRPNVKDPGEVRPGWEVLCELAAALDHETGLGSVPDVLAALAGEVGIYSGVDAEEIGGRGVRWQERPSATTLPEPSAETDPADPQPPRADGDGLLLGTYRDLWAGPVTERNPALHFLVPAQRLELASADAERLGLADGEAATVSVNGSSVEATVAIRERLAAGSCFLVEGTAEGNANALLNGAPAVARVEKTNPPAADAKRSTRAE